MLQQHFSSFSLSLETLIQPKFSSQICSNSSFQTPSTSLPPSRFPRRLLKTPRKSQNHSPKPNPDLRKLTSRIVDLTRRRQLHQIFREIELSRRRLGKLNTIVMNAVMEACVHCKDVDSAMRIFQEMSEPDGCGVDSITFATLLKGLGEAQRIDEAFQILESVEQGTAVGNPKLSPSLIHGLLNALLEAGDLRRANGLLARCRSAFHGSSPSILMYNLLMKGYANTGIPLDAVAVRDEISRIGLKPDRRTYNTLIHACVKSGKMDSAMQLVAEMKEEAYYCREFSPDAVTYTTLLKNRVEGPEKKTVTEDPVGLQQLLTSLFVAPPPRIAIHRCCLPSQLVHVVEESGLGRTSEPPEKKKKRQQPALHTFLALSQNRVVEERKTTSHLGSPSSQLFSSAVGSARRAICCTGTCERVGGVSRGDTDGCVVSQCYTTLGSSQPLVLKSVTKRNNAQNLLQDVWNIVKKGYKGSNDPTDAADKKLFENDSKARNALMCGLSDSELVKVMSCKTLKEIWDKL
ncbi:hypothetical protein MRB53_008893 [Persea americana]|uniref:Uncharacterized protein n=1 Tax=Persea americana TaxID=3435 RepID=A0ACC2LNM1_PERAE|nr:hypothetical protein MRB53_008893 [Persea americana]